MASLLGRQSAPTKLYPAGRGGSSEPGPGPPDAGSRVGYFSGHGKGTGAAGRWHATQRRALVSERGDLLQGREVQSPGGSTPGLPSLHPDLPSLLDGTA